MKTKICSKCGKELPLTEEYFYKRKDNKDGFRADCKKCKDVRIEKPKAKEGMKICTKCCKELPATNEYFNNSKRGLYGLKSVCRSCNKEYGKKYREDFEQNNFPDENINKTCTKCGNEYPATTEYFRNSKYGKNGLRGECKECSRKLQKEYFEQNKDICHKRSNKYKEEHKEELKEYGKIYHKENYHKFKDTRKEYNKQYYQEHKEEIKQRTKKYEKENIDKLRYKKIERTNKRRTLKKKLLATLTIAQWEKIKKDFNYKCAYCGKDEEKHLNEINQLLQQEHFIALTKGGEYSHNNIIPSCEFCNCSKNNKDFFEWYPQQPFYSKKREKFILDYLHYTDSGEQQLSIAL